MGNCHMVAGNLATPITGFWLPKPESIAGAFLRKLTDCWWHGV